ncbi:MAG: hypothetical protein QME51_08895 [Planctomycetota bacterium]|nr:hypothetical protein [Planctomycetota bacterium]MDI6788473.1 hypothetical protein [Planctomycetota bacterium]
MIESISTLQVIEVWLAVGFTLMMYSFLYKDNPLFKLGEYIYVGLSAGYGLCYAWYVVVWPDLVLPLKRVIGCTLGQPLPVDKPLESYETFWLIIPLVLGIFMLTRFSAKIGWLSRYSFAFIIGASSGMIIPNAISANIFKQIVPTLQPLWGKDITILQTADTVIILIGVLSVLIYFFFSVEHKGVIKGIARVGIFYMMVAFGAAFGYTVMARESLAIGRLTKLVNWADKEYLYASIILFFVVAGIIILWELLRHKEHRIP